MDYEAADIEKMVEAVLDEHSSWTKNTAALGLLPKDWVPPVVGLPKEVVYVHAVEELSDAWKDRLLLTVNAGKSVYLACPSVNWLYADTLEFAAENHIKAIDLSEEGTTWVSKTYRSCAELIARRRISLPRPVLKNLSMAALTASKNAKSNAEKGSTFEDFLLFLFCGVADFEFVERNVNTATEEIDLVFINRGATGRIWTDSRLIVVSAKNWSSTVGRREVSDLETYVRNRRGQCRLGFLCASGSISEEAILETLRLSRDNYLFPLLDGSDLDALVSDIANLDDCLERIVMDKTVLK